MAAPHVALRIAGLLPQEGFVRERQLVRNNKTGEPGVLPFGRSTLWAKIKAQEFPAPTKRFGSAISCWPVDQIRAYLAAEAGNEAPKGASHPVELTGTTSGNEAWKQKLRARKGAAA